MQISFIDVICYNHEYPTTFYVDVSYVNLDRPYTIGDLANTFPPGLILDTNSKRKMDPKRQIFFFKRSDYDGEDGDINRVLETMNFGKQLQKKKKAESAASTTTAASTPAKKGK